MPSPFFPYCIVVYGTEIWNYFEPNKGTNLSKDYEKYRRFFLSAEMLFAISKGTADLLISYLPEVTPKVYVVNCGVNLNRLKDPSPVQKEKIHKELKIESSNVILCVARFGKDKGQDVLSRAFKLVLNTFPNTVLIFVGEGPKRSDIESLVERLSISQNIRFVGNVSGEDLPVYYDICDIFAMPSRCVERWEGFGIVFLEANYRKKPVIAGDAGGVPDAVKDGFNGFLVDPMDHEAIATKIIDLLKHPELRQRLGENGYLRVVNEKNSNNEASKMLDKLNEIVSQYKSDSLINLLAKKIGALKWLLTGLARWSISSFNQTLHSILNYLFK
jgi:glycosyltransferase involved in cell wall biosynthesis